VRFAEFLRIGRHSLTVEGVPLSFSVSTRGWARYGNLYIGKSTVGPSGADAIIYWTSVSDGAHAEPCGQWWSSPVESMADFAAEASRKRGTEPLTGPSDVTLDGRAGQHVVFTVQQEVSCYPGFFYTWQQVEGGPFWNGIEVGDTIRIWLIKPGGKVLYIEGATHKNAGSNLEQEIQQIVKSIRFD
jgi:hypothetical protein